MTKRLYQINSHQKTFTSEVRSLVHTERGYLVTLSESAFFPTAGGQPNDLGTIDEATVLDVFERDGELYHLVNAPLAINSRVTGTIDWTRRFDFMQQHTGEHLFSFVLYDRYQAHNVGFHLAVGYATIDMDISLTKEQLDEAVLITNAILSENRPVTAHSFESEEALKASRLPLRKHAEGLVPPIRIVSIEGADACTCCAPHCAYTGEVGSLLVTDAVPYKGGTRITFLCGQRAVKRAQEEHRDLDAIAQRFSTARAEAAGAVMKQFDALASERARIKRLTDELNGFYRDSLLSEALNVGKKRIAVRLFDEMDAKQLSALAALVTKEANTLAVLFSRTAERTNYLLAASAGFPVDVGELIQAVNALTGGKGGGRGQRAQGMTGSPVPPEALEQLKQYLVKRLK